MKDSFILHKAQLDPIKGLTAEEKGMLLEAILNYQFEGKTTNLSPMLNMAFSFIKSQLDIDNKKYIKICERNKENGDKGGRPKQTPVESKKPSGLFENPNNPNELKKPSGLCENPGNPDKPKKPDNENDNKNGNEELFNQFWDLYDKKTGKQNSQKQWNKLSSRDIEAIFKHVPLYKQSNPDKQFRKDPERYLKYQTWKDEIITPGLNIKTQTLYESAKGLKR